MQLLTALMRNRSRGKGGRRPMAGQAIPKLLQRDRMTRGLITRLDEVSARGSVPARKT